MEDQRKAINRGAVPCFSEEATLGNGLKLKNTFDDYGYLEKTITEDIFEEKLEYSLLNKSRGNVGKRIDLKNGITERFSYDNLDRLTTIEVNGSVYKQMNFSDNGNIQEQSGLGPYAYDANKFNAVTAIDVQDLAASKIPSFTQDIGYTSFNKAKSIEENSKHLTIDYGFDEERRKVVYKENDETKWTKYYSLDYEKIVDENNIVTEVSYINSPSGLLMLQVKEDGANVNYYTHTDYQGTIRALTNTEGEVQYEQRFDPWGNRIAVETYSQDIGAELPHWLRGYTGHEHLDMFSLINMNGRMYDPVVGRMLSPDKYVQEPENIQNYNRYSYALNNPIKYTDPSGWNFSPGMPGSPNYAGGAMGGAAQVAYVTMGGAPLKAVSAYANIGKMQIGRWYYDGYGSVKQYVGYGNGEWSFSFVDMSDGGQLYLNAFENISYSSNVSSNSQPEIKQAWLYNFVGPGPDMDPRMIPDPQNKGDFLRPMNDIDYSAFKHDISYYENNAGGVSGALFDLSVTEADGELAFDAYKVFFNSILRNKDSVTGKPTSIVTGIQSGYVGALFLNIYIYKSIIKHMDSSSPIYSYY